MQRKSLILYALILQTTLKVYINGFKITSNRGWQSDLQITNNFVILTSLNGTEAIQMHYPNGIFVQYDQRFQQLASSDINNQTVFKDLTYFNSSIDVGITTQKQEKLIMFSRIEKKVLLTYRSHKGIVSAKILHFDSQNIIIVVVGLTSVYQIKNNLQTKKQLLSLDEIDFHDNFLGIAAINQTCFLLPTKNGRIFIFNYTLNSIGKSQQISYAYKMLNSSQLNYKKTLFANSSSRYFVFSCKSDPISITEIQNLKLSKSNLIGSGKQLIRIQKIDRTQVYFVCSNHMIKASDKEMKFNFVKNVALAKTLDISQRILLADNFQKPKIARMIQSSQDSDKVLNFWFLPSNNIKLRKVVRILASPNVGAGNSNKGNTSNSNVSTGSNQTAGQNNSNLNSTIGAINASQNSTQNKNSTANITGQINSNQQNANQATVTNGSNQTQNLSSKSNNSNSINTNQQHQNNTINHSNITSNLNNLTLPINAKINAQYISQIYQKAQPYIKTIADTSMNLNSFPAMRNLLKLLVPFFAFFDDYWYYIYHDNQFYQLQIIPCFLALMYKINSERIVPDQFNTEEIQRTISFQGFFSSSYQNYTNPQILNINQQQTYFTLNLQDMFTLQYVLTLIIFLVLKIFTKFYCIILKFCYSKNSVIQEPNQFRNESHPQNSNIWIDIKNFFQKYTEWQNLIVLFIEANILLIAFNVGLQFHALFGFKFSDKINLAISCVYGFICIFYAFNYYFIFHESDLRKKIYRQAKRSKKNILKLKQNIKSVSRKFEQVYGTKDKKNSLMVLIRFQTYFVCLKCLLFGLAHSIFIKNNYIQLSVLILIKIVLIRFGQRLARKFTEKRHKWTFLSVVVYYYIGIVFDLLLVISKMKSQQIVSFEENILLLTQKIIFGGLLASVFLQFIVYLWNFVYELCYSEITKQKRRSSLCSINDRLTILKIQPREFAQKPALAPTNISKNVVFEYLQSESVSATPENLAHEPIFDARKRSEYHPPIKKDEVKNKKYMFHKRVPQKKLQAEQQSSQRPKETEKDVEKDGKRFIKRYIHLKKFQSKPATQFWSQTPQ